LTFTGTGSGWPYLTKKTKPPTHIQQMAEKIDANDGEPWTEMDIRDLTAALEHASTIEEAAEHLCRSGTLDEGMPVAPAARPTRNHHRNCRNHKCGSRVCLLSNSDRLGSASH